MHTKASLMKQLEQLDIEKHGTLLVHSSLKSMGEVEHGANTVLDALSEYMKGGLLVLPTHTWANINADNPKFHVDASPSCIGILPELFRKRQGVVRSWHPTHSVAALGADAIAFTTGEERCDTPCARESVWGKLLDREAAILLIGVDLRRNTFMHGVEEWADIPGRVSDEPELLYTVLPDGTEIPVPSRRHYGKNWSEHFWKVEDVFEQRGVMYKGTFGDAEARVCNAVRMTDLLFEMLHVFPDLFSDNEPLSAEFTNRFMRSE